MYSSIKRFGSSTGNGAGCPIRLADSGGMSHTDKVAAVNDSVSSNTSLANTAKQNLQAAVGVNQNNELVSLMNFQQTYQAAAKVISTVDSAVQSLLNAV